MHIRKQYPARDNKTLTEMDFMCNIYAAYMPELPTRNKLQKQEDELLEWRNLFNLFIRFNDNEMPQDRRVIILDNIKMKIRALTNKTD
jgi:hypothetical protein